MLHFQVNKFGVSHVFLRPFQVGVLLVPHPKRGGAFETDPSGFRLDRLPTESALLPGDGLFAQPAQRQRARRPLRRGRWQRHGIRGRRGAVVGGRGEGSEGNLSCVGLTPN